MKTFVLSLLVFAAACGSASATGTVRIQQTDGSVKVYRDVKVWIADQTLWLQSSDGKGTLVIGKAACTKVGEVFKCLPYDATLVQNGNRLNVPLRSGTVWVNPTQQPQPLSHTASQLPPHGILMAIQSRAGTYVSLTGTIDKVQK